MGLAFANLMDLEEEARAILPKPTFDYIAGGAEDEVALRRNREAYRRWALRPRVLVDVSRVDTSVAVLGQQISMPILIAPTAFHGLVHPEGEVATARGAMAARTLMVASTLANRSMEEIAAPGPAARWFQLYLYRDRAVTESLVKRAASAGYQALCVTVDAAVAGRRERDERNGFTLPPGLRMRNLEAAGLDALPASESGASGLAAYWGAMNDRTFTWRDLAWLGSLSALPIVLKGIMTPEDAVVAVEHGARGIVVSNHGGRQLDETVGTLDALPEVVDAVGPRAEVFIDGGVRRGTDVLKALALGARAVLVGRPILYGLALGGSDGVRSVLEHLRSELVVALTLAGTPTVDAINRSVVVRAT